MNELSRWRGNPAVCLSVCLAITLANRKKGRKGGEEVEVQSQASSYNDEAGRIKGGLFHGGCLIGLARASAAFDRVHGDRRPAFVIWRVGLMSGQGR